LFPESEYGGVIFYDLIEEEYLSFSEDGLSNSGRLELISQYQGFVNKYSKHPNVVKAENNIEWFEEDLMEFLNSQFDDSEIDLGWGIEFIRQRKKYIIPEKDYRNDIREWLMAGTYPEFGIEVVAGKTKKRKNNLLVGYSIPEKKTEQN